MICPDIFHWNTGTLCLVYSWSNRPNVRSGLFRSGSLIRSILDYCRTGCTRLSFNDVTLIISVLQFQNKRKFTWNWTIYSRKIWLLHNVWRRCQRWRASISLLVARKPEWLRFRIFQTEACTGRIAIHPNRRRSLPHRHKPTSTECTCPDSIDVGWKDISASGFLSCLRL